MHVNIIPEKGLPSAAWAGESYKGDIKMNQNRKWITYVCVLLLVAASLAGGFFLGKNSVNQQVQKEKEFNIMLNRSELDGLKDIEGTIYVTGHKSPDSDTVGSSIACAYLMRQLGYDAVPVVLGPLNHESEFILKSAGIEMPELLEDASGLNMILVDHSEYTQSAEGLKDAHIISIIDHHADGAVTTGSQLIYDARPLGSTATILWIRFRNYGVEPDQKTAAAMIGSILSDTKNMQSDTATNADREALNEIAKIPDLDAFYQEMYKALLSYEGMSDEEIIFSDYKEYEAGGKKYSIGCVNAYDEETAKDLAERMKKAMPAAKEKQGMDMAFAAVSILHDDLSVTYVVPADEASDEVLQLAIGDDCEFDGTSCVTRSYRSRKAALVPAITEILEAYPQE